MMARDVGAVRDHRAHAEREGEEGVTEGLEHGVGLELREIRSEDEAQRFTRPAHPQGADQQQEQDPEEDRQEEARDALDSLADPEVDDGHGSDAEAEGERELQAGVAHLLVEQVARGQSGREAAESPFHRPGEVVDRPAGDDRVVAEQDEGADDAPASHDAPGGPRDRLERPDRALLAFSPDEQLRHHDGQPDGGDADKVHEHEGSAVVLPGYEGELPQVAQSDGASGGRQDESQI